MRTYVQSILNAEKTSLLRNQAGRIDVRLINAWPREAKPSRSRFETLKAAYVKARYSRHYHISVEELNWLAERVTAPAAAVEQVCYSRIAQLEREAR